MRRSRATTRPPPKCRRRSQQARFPTRACSHAMGEDMLYIVGTMPRKSITIVKNEGEKSGSGNPPSRCARDGASTHTFCNIVSRKSPSPYLRDKTATMLETDDKAEWQPCHKVSQEAPSGYDDAKISVLSPARIHHVTRSGLVSPGDRPNIRRVRGKSDDAGDDSRMGGRACWPRILARVQTRAPPRRRRGSQKRRWLPANRLVTGESNCEGTPRRRSLAK